MKIISFKPNNITKKFTSGLKERTKDIVVQRFGLGESTKRKTLEAIGQKYGITRERVRQLENFAINSIKQSPVFESSQDIFDELRSVIDQKGKLLSEQEILNHLVDDQKLRNHIHFLLVLGDDFKKFKEDDEFHHRWTVDEENAEKVHDILRGLHKSINEDDLIPEQEVISLLKKKSESFVEKKIEDEVVRSWLNISKIVAGNIMGEWGLASSPSVKPWGMRDYAFLVLKKHGSPMHFTEVAENITEHFEKSAHSATVHNELIKDARFVLVGRGLYALNEWGYKTGTVSDIIKEIIKENKSITKEEVIKSVLKERYVKENTILVNLQNRNYFKRNKDGTYSIA